MRRQLVQFVPQIIHKFYSSEIMDIMWTKKRFDEFILLPQQINLDWKIKLLLNAILPVQDIEVGVDKCAAHGNGD